MSLDDDSPFWRSPADGPPPGGTEPSRGIEVDKFAAFDDEHGLVADAPAGHVPVDATHPASEGAALRRSAQSDRVPRPTEPGTLASKVLALRILEDDIAALLGEVECALRALEAERTLEDAGFRSADDFRDRVAPQMGLLHAMRESKRRIPQATGKVRKRSHARPRGNDLRTRRTQALAAIEQAMGRFRELGRGVHGKVEEARDLLAAIDHQKTYAECGYASFEEFLELAIGPSPILTKCLTVLGDFPPPPPPPPEAPALEATGSDEEELPSFAEPPGPVVSDDRPPALFELPPEEPPSEEAATDSAAPDEASSTPARQRRLQRSAIIVSVTLGVMSAIIGTAAGVRASRAAQEAADAPAPVAASAAPPEASTAPRTPSPAAASPEAKHGSLLQVASQPAATLPRRGHDDRPAAPAAHPADEAR